MENSRETKKNNGPLPEFHELFCHEYQKEKHIHYHQNGHFGSQEASFVSGNDRKTVILPGFTPDLPRIYPGIKADSYHFKVWEKKDPSTTSKPKKAKKDDKNQVTSGSEASSSSVQQSVQQSVQHSPVPKIEIRQIEPKIEPTNPTVPMIKIEQDVQSPPKMSQARFESAYWPVRPTFHPRPGS